MHDFTENLLNGLNLIAICALIFLTIGQGLFINIKRISYSSDWSELFSSILQLPIFVIIIQIIFILVFSFNNSIEMLPSLPPFEQLSGIITVIVLRFMSVLFGCAAIFISYKTIDNNYF